MAEQEILLKYMVLAILTYVMRCFHLLKKLCHVCINRLMTEKEILLKCVVQAIPIYVMSCFHLLKRLCQAMQGVMSSY